MSISKPEAIRTHQGFAARLRSTLDRHQLNPSLPEHDLVQIVFQVRSLRLRYREVEGDVSDAWRFCEVKPHHSALTK